MKDELANRIRIFLENNGIDPIYFATVIVLLIMISYRENIKNWDEQKGWQKGIIISSAYGAVVLVIISVLRLIGVINF